MLRVLGTSGGIWLLKEYQGIIRSFDCFPIVHQMINHHSFPSFEKKKMGPDEMIGNPGFSNAYSELCFLHLCPVDIFELLEKKLVHLLKSLCLNSSRSEMRDLTYFFLVGIVLLTF